MKTTITINGKDVEIELTQDQVNKIKQASTHYTDIKTLQDALDYVGETLDSFNVRSQFDDDVQRAYKELEVIVQAVRQGNALGNKEDDKWYYPYFYSKRSSAGFSFSDYNYGHTASIVGPRLCVESSEKAKYLGTQFIETYDRYINGSPLALASRTVIEKREFKSHEDIRTFEDACLAIGENILAFEALHRGKPADSYAYEQLKVISKALNGGDHLNYDDADEYKYYPYFNAKGSSAGFSYHDYNCGNTRSSVGSRLTYKTSDLAEYAGRTFLEIYNNYIN